MFRFCDAAYKPVDQRDWGIFDWSTFVSYIIRDNNSTIRFFDCDRLNRSNEKRHSDSFALCFLSKGSRVFTFA